MGFRDAENQWNSLTKWKKSPKNILKSINVDPIKLNEEFKAYSPIPYDFLFQNSNTAIGDVLRSIGVEVPSGMGWTPGWRWPRGWILW